MRSPRSTSGPSRRGSIARPSRRGARGRASESTSRSGRGCSGAAVVGVVRDEDPVVEDGEVRRDSHVVASLVPAFADVPHLLEGPVAACGIGRFSGLVLDGPPFEQEIRWTISLAYTPRPGLARDGAAIGRVARERNDRGASMMLGVASTNGRERGGGLAGPARYQGPSRGVAGAAGRRTTGRSRE